MKPKSIAIVGASAQPGKIGYTVVKNIINSGYKGQIYPINPSAPEILGLKCYPSVLPLPGKASLVSQSGALLIAIDASSYLRHVGFDKLISIGNMSDVDFSDTIR